MPKPAISATATLYFVDWIVQFQFWVVKAIWGCGLSGWPAIVTHCCGKVPFGDRLAA